jgi:RimJ/RimL family protein N-acetyltransferase
LVKECISIYSGGDIEDSEGAWENFEIVVDGEKVGFAAVKMWDDGSALIERIDIDDAHQNRGYGSQAIRMISADHDACYIVPDNADAQRLYERIGYETTDDLRRMPRISAAFFCLHSRRCALQAARRTHSDRADFDTIFLG